MSITTKFFDDKGNLLSSRKFAKRQWININVVPTGASGLPSIGTLVRCDIIESGINIYSKQLSTNFWGIANFQLQLPAKDIHAVVHVYAEYSVHGSENVDVPIAVGSTNPRPLPEETSNSWWLYPLLVGVALVAAYGGYKAYKVAH